MANDNSILSIQPTAATSTSDTGQITIEGLQEAFKLIQQYPPIPVNSSNISPITIEPLTLTSTPLDRANLIYRMWDMSILSTSTAFQMLNIDCVGCDVPETPLPNFTRSFKNIEI